MCGIAGFWTPGGAEATAAEATVRGMATAVQHRGPDDAGVWCDGAAGLALGHRRLSIVDLTAEGHQPMVSRDGRWVLDYTGEIYNHPELRAALEASGTRFRGRVLETTTFGPHPSVIPEVEGEAYITGRHEFLIDPEDPLRNGFILR